VCEGRNPSTLAKLPCDRRDKRGGEYVLLILVAMNVFGPGLKNGLMKNIVTPVQEKLPPVQERTIVVCKTFRCLGYMDENGVWRDDARSKPLEDVIGWMEFPD
jgi:hypothetical protein